MWYKLHSQKNDDDDDGDVGWLVYVNVMLIFMVNIKTLYIITIFATDVNVNNSFYF